MKTRAHIIVDTVVARLEAYTGALSDDYFVFSGRRNFEESDLCNGPHITVFALSETVEKENDCAVIVTLAVTVEGHALVADHDAPAGMAHTLAGHIKQAVFSETPATGFTNDFRLEGSEFIYPSDGSDVVNASVEIAVKFTEPKTAIFIDED